MKVFLFDSFEVIPAVGIIEPQQEGELSRIDFGKPAGELGCYLNYEERDPEPCTDKQRELIAELGCIFPEGLTRIEANCIISRARGRDSLGSPDLQLVELATGLKIRMSGFIGSKDLMRKIIRHNLKDQAALYCYGVLQSIKGDPFGNMLEDEHREVFYDFASLVENDRSLKRSLDDRQDSEFIKPKTSVKIYKAAVDYLKAGGII